MAEILSDDKLPVLLYEMPHDLLAAMLREEERVEALDKRICQWVSGNPIALKLATWDGVGPLTASAVVAQPEMHPSLKRVVSFQLG